MGEGTTPPAQLLMASNRPQNPVYAVDAKAYDACLPKVICGHCGAVLSLRMSKDRRRLRCCACGNFNDVYQVDGVWKAGQRPGPGADSSGDREPQ